MAHHTLIKDRIGRQIGYLNEINNGKMIEAFSNTKGLVGRYNANTNQTFDRNGFYANGDRTIALIEAASK